MKRTLFLLVFTALCSAASADRQDGRHRDGPRVILFQDADYRGDSFVVYPGDDIEDFSRERFPDGRGLNDSVSSIRIEGGAEVFVYENSNFRGASMRLSDDARDLTARRLSNNSRDNWNDRISSIRVEGSGRRGGDGRDRDRERDRELAYDATIRRAYKDLLGRDPDQGGLRNYRSLMIDQGWTERMVRDHIRHGDEFRREGAERIIRRAYLDVLGREVDPSGLNHYRKALLESDWTEGDVRDDLRRSDEFKNRARSHSSGR
jgi:uncharacterized protein DUF4214